MCVNHTNTRIEDVELVETLASTMTESPELGNLLIAMMAMVKQGGNLCLGIQQPQAAAQEGAAGSLPPGIYPPPDTQAPGNYL